MPVGGSATLWRRGGGTRPFFETQSMAAPLYVFIKRVGDAAFASDHFVEIELCDGDTAARLTKRACKEFPHWGLHSEKMALFLVTGGSEEARLIERNPASAAGILQREPLFSGDPVRPGSWLLARVPPPIAAAPPALGASVTRLAARAPACMSDL